LIQVESIMGADLYITCRFSPNYVNEGPILDFIHQQNAIDNAFHSYSFVSSELTDIVKAIAPGTD
jgi:hypothetical protein